MEKKLILLEGIPGSGKSTFARFISIQLQRNGYQSLLFHETTYDHPIILSDSIKDENMWIEAYLKRWHTFLNRQFDNNSVIVMESVLFQNPILNLLNKDVARERILSLIKELCLMTSQCSVSLIFFHQKDTITAIDNMIKSRGGSEFLNRKYEEFKNEKYYESKESRTPTT
ncbi:hypothetical protein [Halalkalibacter urbisdiaboli]|uniref:hypothetical protein n=1 Tax=Halalkalibacter urbisdiaboli TaxID=1960589 RepID=UPI000B439ECE|nr:hypothetical protein [Halalkalibacter urbisdiaboli]